MCYQSYIGAETLCLFGIRNIPRFPKDLHFYPFLKTKERINREGYRKWASRFFIVRASLVPYIA